MEKAEYKKRYRSIICKYSVWKKLKQLSLDEQLPLTELTEKITDFYITSTIMDESWDDEK